MMMPDQVVTVVMGRRCVFCGFFFFQAEDGIRDYKVTGVQTCALPIFGRTFIEGVNRADRVRMKYTPLREVLEGKRVLLIEDTIVRSTTLKSLLHHLRSEERRVGKEGRSRWSPYH